MPHRIAALKAGQRGEYPLDRLTEIARLLAKVCATESQLIPVSGDLSSAPYMIVPDMEEPIELGRTQARRRACIAIAALASIWAYAVAITGGFVVGAGPVRFSSRTPRTALALVILAGVMAWISDRKGGWQWRWAADLKWLTASVVGAIPQVARRHATPRAFAGAVAAVTAFGGIVWGAHVAGGADSYGYVSIPQTSDIVAAAWWTTTIVLVWRPGRLTALAAGAAMAAAILTRPNLVPLAAVLGGVFLSGLWPRGGRSLAAQRLPLFTAPAAAACVVVAWLNAYWYGSPLASGYGTLAGGLFRWEYFWPNFANYSAWTLESQGALSLLSLVGLPALWRSARARGEQAMLTALICFGVTVYACYAFYLPLDAWWHLRFLFPAFPVFFILIVAGGLAVIDRLPDIWRSVGVAALVAAMTVHTTAFGRSVSAFSPGGEMKYEIVGRYINDHMPPHAAFFTMLHSGSVRHYSGRLTVRYDLIQPDRFEAMVTHLQHRGYATFLLIDDGEENAFRRQFSGSRVLDSLGSPQVRFPSVGLYRLPDSAAR